MSHFIYFLFLQLAFWQLKWTIRFEITWMLHSVWKETNAHTWHLTLKISKCCIWSKWVKTLLIIQETWYFFLIIGKLFYSVQPIQETFLSFDVSGVFRWVWLILSLMRQFLLKDRNSCLNFSFCRSMQSDVVGMQKTRDVAKLLYLLRNNSL